MRQRSADSNPPHRSALPATSITSGANDVAAFLITGPEGHVVIDGGYPTTAPMIMASIAKLGFDIKDVKVLLNSEPHPDHGGGLGVIQQASGAEVWASDASADSLASGGDDPDMFLPMRALVWIGVVGYPPIRVDHRFKDGDTIRLGPIELTAHITAGHTRGCTSWSFPVRDGDRVLNVVSVCDPGVLEMSSYPEQAADRERSLRVLRSLPVDIWVTNHARAWAGTASSSRALRRRTQWIRSSTPRAIAPTSMPPRRSYAADACTNRSGAPANQFFVILTLPRNIFSSAELPRSKYSESNCSAAGTPFSYSATFVVPTNTCNRSPLFLIVTVTRLIARSFENPGAATNFDPPR